MDFNAFQNFIQFIDMLYWLGSMALAEIKNLKKLPQHPNLVQYSGYHFHSDSFWVAMEFCDMGDLSEYYKKHYPERVPLAHQVHFMYQVISKDQKEKNPHALEVSAKY